MAQEKTQEHAGAVSRGPGRPAEETPRPCPRPVRFTRDVDDRLCQLANRTGVPIHGLIRRAVDQFLGG
jgi:hypothetical protein